MIEAPKKILLISAMLLFLLAGSLAPQSYQNLNISKQEIAKTFKTDLFMIFNLGLKRAYADLLWIQTLLESDLEHYKKSDLNSWMYHRFNVVTDLDPYFLQAYQFGGQYLSVIKDDDQGALEIYKKGLNYYPNDFLLNFYLGTHYYLELDDSENALTHYDIASQDSKAPFFLRSLVARLMAEQGEIQDSFNILMTLYKNAEKGSDLKEKYFNSLYAVKAEIDLKCLNANESNCMTKDLEGNNYIENNGVWQTKKAWRKFRPFKRKINL